MLPVTDDRDSGPFFAAATEGRLAFRACTSCGRGIHPPVPYCPYCGGEGAWRTASGHGTLHSATVVTHQIHPDYPTPYTIVLVQLDDSAEVRLVGRIDGAAMLPAGTPMKVWFEQVDDGITLPNWRPTSG